ncbi:MAG TPA: cytochrome c oxidase subunit II [Bryobacteraceae bacterium]|jgi:cytochrome c oxidase subunit 2|nr:cytochrome c oxidase subunit II [Bryobacteraceae bacterium]
MKLCSVVFTSLLLTGCAGVQQSAVDPAGPQSGRIADLLWFFLGLLTAIFVAVIIVTAVALTRRHRGFAQEPLEQTHLPSEATERKLTRNVSIASIATTLILIGLIVASVSTGNAISDYNPHINPLTVEVTANQWWWYVRYPNDIADLTVTTANEIHIPVGRPIMIRGTSNDVIHSFWVPNLHGKADLIPSRVRTEWIQADRPGRFRGQCAEFCGLQHAHMSFWVIAEPQPQFDAWMNRQRQPAIEPENDDTRRGQQVFLSHACALCHSIQGTTAAGSAGPDLTHLASRASIAAGTLPNTKGNLAGWIVDPQSIKPGNRMATVPLQPEDIQPLIDYLGSLQ